MIDDPDIPLETPAERMERIEQTVAEVLRDAGVTYELRPGRRRSDITFLELMGEKQRVLEQPLKLLDRLPFEDVELLSSVQGEDGYLLTLIVTEQLEQQERATPERRAKLKHLLDREGLKDE